MEAKFSSIKKSPNSHQDFSDLAGARTRECFCIRRRQLNPQVEKLEVDQVRRESPINFSGKIWHKKSPNSHQDFSDLAGARTQDPYIKSVLLYQLSYQIIALAGANI